jgi:hypothetical protein
MASISLRDRGFCACMTPLYHEGFRSPERRQVARSAPSRQENDRRRRNRRPRARQRRREHVAAWNRRPRIVHARASSRGSLMKNRAAGAMSFVCDGGQDRSQRFALCSRQVPVTFQLRSGGSRGAAAPETSGRAARCRHWASPSALLDGTGLAGASPAPTTAQRAGTTASGHSGVNTPGEEPEQSVCHRRHTSPSFMPGCLVAWLPGCLVAWLPGCLVAWLPGCLVAWLPGCRR